LTVHQALGQGGVAQPGKAVVVTGEVGDPAALQLAGQPLAAVEPNLDIEGNQVWIRLPMKPKRGWR
jgi:hypothetical protein